MQPVPAPVPAPKRVTTRVVAPTLVGRAAELELLVAAATAPPAIVTLEGEAGLGKTRLVTELAAHPEMSGRRFLVGGCRRIREPFPLGPVIEAVRGFGDDLARARFSAVVGALRPLLPELAHHLPAQPPPLDDPAGKRHRVFRALTEILASTGPAVLVLEDLHWADEQTRDFLDYLLAHSAPGLALVLTFRGEEVDPAVRALTAKLPTSTRRTEVVLAPLDEVATGTLAAAILETDQISGEFAAYLRERTAGLPFAIEEVLALLRERRDLVREGGRWARKALDALHVPTAIRDPVLERVSRLSKGARRVVEAAAALQSSVPFPVLVATCDLDEARAARGAEEALGSGLLVEHDEAIGFRHLLAAQAVYEAIPGPRRQGLHSRAASVLKALHQVPLGQVAHHLRLAGRLDEWVEAAEEAADVALGLGHDAEAARLLEEVLRQAPLDGDRRGRVAVKLARAVNETLHITKDVTDLLSQVLEERLPEAVRGELALCLALALHQSGGDPHLLRQLFTEAVDNLGDRPDLRAWAMVGLAIPVVPGVPLSETKHWIDRVLELLPDVDDRVFEVFLLGKVAMMLASMGDPAWHDLIERIEERTGGSPRQYREVNAYYSVGREACYVGHHETAHRLLNRGLEGAVACENRRLELMIRSALTLCNFRRGAWDPAGRDIDVLLTELADYPLFRIDVEVVAGGLAVAHGDLDAGRHKLSEAMVTAERVGAFEALTLPAGALVRLHHLRGDLDGAVTIAKRCLDVVEVQGEWASVSPALPPAVEALVAAGQTAQARSLLGRCVDELGDRDVALAPAAIAFARGVLAAASSDWREAIDQFLDAAARYDALPCPYEAAQARERAGECLATTGDDRAGEILLAALASYGRMGASWDAARCARAGRSHGVRLPEPHRGGRRGYGDALSPREEQVARLAATGRTNREIAADLFLSPTTVDKHLGRAMRKLGVHSRRAIAARLSEQPREDATRR